MIHNDFADTGAIARSAAWQARIALEAGWRVTLVAAHVDPDLAPHVEQRRLYIPPALHLVQWLAARSTVRRAMGNTRYDLVVGHQPQIASIVDVWHVRFLSRPNVDAGGLPAGSSVRDVVRRLQFRGVARAEDHYLNRLSDTTEVVFHSAALRDVFASYYGMPPLHTVLPNPGPDPRDPADEDRRAACRNSFGIADDVFVVGFLGGADPRKGADRLLDAVRRTRDVHVLLAGAGSEDLGDRGLGPRVHRAGFLDRSRTWDFYDAIDVLAVPSRFEPWGVVVNEAAATGTPSIVAPTVGAGSALVSRRAGMVWDPDTGPLEDVLRVLRSDQVGYRDRALDMARELSFTNMASKFLDLYRAAMGRKRRSRPETGGA